MALPKTQVLNVKRIVPKMVQALRPKPIRPEIKQLSDFDNVPLLRCLLPIIFFYPRAIGRTKTMDPAKTISDGIAKVLVPYYPLAGQVVEGPSKKLVVDCNNEGVSFGEADANLKLEQLRDGIVQPCLNLEDLLPEFDGMPILNSPIIRFQVTRFMCGGFSLGIQFNHVLGDAAGFMQFLNALAEVLNGASTPSIPPVWKRELLNARSPPKITSTHDEFVQYMDNHIGQSISSPKHLEDSSIRIPVFFGPREIQSLRNQLGTTQRSLATTFDLMTACLWKCRTMALEPPSNDMVRLTFTTNARNQKEIDLPAGYYGNASGNISTISKASNLCENPLAYAVNLVQQVKAKISGEHFRSLLDFYVTKGPVYFDCRSNFVITDIRRMGFDKLDLGWGMPFYAGNPWATSSATAYSNFRNDMGEDGFATPICLPRLNVEKFQYELHKMIHA